MLDMQSLCLFNSKYDTKMHPMIFWKQIMDTQVFRFLKYDVYDTISKCRVHVEDLRYTYIEASVLHSMTYRILKLQHASFWLSPLIKLFSKQSPYVNGEFHHEVVSFWHMYPMSFLDLVHIVIHISIIVAMYVQHCDYLISQKSIKFSRYEALFRYVYT